MNCKGMIKYLPVVLLLCACTENELLLKEHEAFAVRFFCIGHRYGGGYTCRFATGGWGQRCVSSLSGA